MEIGNLTGLLNVKKQNDAGATKTTKVKSLGELVKIDTENLLSVIEAMQAISGYGLMKTYTDNHPVGISVVETVGNIGMNVSMPGIGRIGSYISESNISNSYFDNQLIYIANNLRLGKRIDDIQIPISDIPKFDILPKPRESEKEKYISYFIRLLENTDKVYFVLSNIKIEVYVGYLSILSSYEEIGKRQGQNSQVLENGHENIVLLDDDRTQNDDNGANEQEQNDLFAELFK